MLTFLPYGSHKCLQLKGRSASRQLYSQHTAQGRLSRAVSLGASSFEVPELEGSVEFYQRELHAQFDSKGRVVTFERKEDRVLSQTDTFIYDRHHWGRFRVEGNGALEFLHNKTTNAFLDRQPGQGCDTVFCTAKGKINDLATVYIQNAAAFVILSPDVQEELVPALEKFVFPGDRVEFVDMRSKTRLFSLYGPSSHQLLSLLSVDKSILEGDYGSHQVMGFNGSPVIVAKGNELDRENGFTMIVDDSVSGDLYKNLVDAGGVPIGLQEWEVLRVVQGRPSLESELQLATNPFEADLFHAVALDKGCFLGQESISRVYTRNAIRKRLWGIQLPSTASIAPQIEITLDGKTVGSITSPPIQDPHSDRMLALGFLNTKVNREAIQWDKKEVSVSGTAGVVVSLPYMTFDFIDGKGAPTSPTADPEPDKKVESKEEKLKAMQERLAAFMNQQKQS